MQRRRTPAQGGVVRHVQTKAERADDGAEQALGLPVGQVEHGPDRERRQDGEREYQGCPPRLVRCSAAHAAVAASVNHTVRLPR